ncbi:EAL domain-containing protein [Lyngbya confervoides BDU141951]|uniref:EAL domain-containing protein n=1 Tax=Lyngbya confervoides BDU141951 TaxID=1574623 RepID=A0ABD4T569_9CYAN|nr:EAL domain-containing protein [Lyngbya confervoides]MCM1983563.1 EAL domain-containing protein [Lyngbya confervoides BDU141951]
MVSLESSSHSIGRDPSNSLVLKAKDVSRQHAMLLRISGMEQDSYGFMLIDGDLQGKRSRNGIMVNGKRCHAPHRLQHGDLIRFATRVNCRYLILPLTAEGEFQKFCQTLNYTQILSEQADCEWSGYELDNLWEAEESDDAFLIRLASFPEINPSPMFEVNLTGELTYLNPAAAAAFRNLGQQGSNHVMVQGLFDLVHQAESNILVREVTVDSRVFEQTIHYLPETDLIRCCAFDITERKHAEAELKKRDRLLQSVAEATTHLLENVAYEAAIDAAIAKLGFAAGADRVCILANHLHPKTQELCTSLQFEWVREAKLSLLKSGHRYNQSLQDSPLAEWHQQLLAEQSIHSTLIQCSEAEREYLNQEQIQSILIVPIFLEKELWGLIELHHCAVDTAWSPQEESIVFAMAASISAALQRQKTEKIIHHQAFHDALTNLPNRILFQERLALALAETSQSTQSVCVMFIDLDRFKRINDTLGHTVGDQLLRAIAERLQRCLPPGATVSRWGGDEFTVLLPQLESITEATEIAQQMIEAIKRPCVVGAHNLFVGASIGIAASPEAGTESETLLQNADVALYQCKEHKSSEYRIYENSMNAKAPEMFMLENSFHGALEKGEFALYYQPKVNIFTQEIVGLEALIRWQHPTMGLVPPSIFIPLAEETGFISEIGSWVLKTACDQIITWHHQGLQPLSVAVNLSAHQFYQPTLLAELDHILSTTQIDPQYLELEITETTAVENIELTTQLLQQVQTLGIHIAMDDFGTGYSSLNYLKQLPLNTLKIDRSFIQDLKPNTKDLEIIRAVVALAMGLDLEIVAEGVDNAEQIQVLKELNCKIVQGYYFSQPLPTAEMTRMLQDNWQQRRHPVTVALNSGDSAPCCPGISLSS